MNDGIYDHSYRLCTTDDRIRDLASAYLAKVCAQVSALGLRLNDVSYALRNSVTRQYFAEERQDRTREVLLKCVFLAEPNNFVRVCDLPPKIAYLWKNQGSGGGQSSAGDGGPIHKI